MKETIEKILAELNELKCSTQKEVEEARVRFLGKKGEITALFEEFRTVPSEMKREFGKTLNELKKQATSKIEELKSTITDKETASAPKQDLSMPGDPIALGSRHPVSIVRQEIVDIFRKFGYDVAEGPEIEDDWHVFEALNFPPNHPAREMQDTFFVSNGHLNPLLLRTHTSSVQVRTMETQPLPIRVICPGRVFRNEAISARARKGLLDRGIRIRMSDTPIIPIYTYDTETTLIRAKQLYEAGVYVNPVLPPATAPTECLLRTSYMASHTEALVDEAVEIIADVLSKPATV